VVFVLVLVSHPLAGLLSQLPHPLEHALNVQVPVAQEADAFGKKHGTLQPPQLVNDVVLVSLLSQLA